MAFIRTQKVKGKVYYSLVQKVRESGRWKTKTLGSFGTQMPTTETAEAVRKRALLLGRPK